MNIEQLLSEIRNEQQRTNALLEQLCGRQQTLVNLDTAARRLGVSRQTIWRRVTAGQ